MKMHSSINGLEVLGRLKKDAHTAYIPVIFSYSKMNLKEFNKGLDNGAAAYMNVSASEDKKLSIVASCFNGKLSDTVN